MYCGVEHYTADKKAIRDRYQPFIDALFKMRRKEPSHPSTEQAFRDLEGTTEWKEFGRRQFQQRKAFSTRERRSLGVIGNAVRLHHANLGRGGFSVLFMLATSGARRQRLFDQVLEGEKQKLRKSQSERRRIRADTLRAACRHELAERAARFERDRKAMLGRQVAEGAAKRAEWRQLAEDRQSHGRTTRGSSPGLGPTQLRSGRQRSTINGRFNQAASGNARPHDGGKEEGKTGGNQGEADGGGPAQPKHSQRRLGTPRTRAGGVALKGIL